MCVLFGFVGGVGNDFILSVVRIGNSSFMNQICNSRSFVGGVGFPCEEHDNPADFFLDVIIACEKNLTGKDSTSNGNVKAIEGMSMVGNISHCILS